MGKDVNGDWNKNSLTEEEQNAVEECAQYVLYSLFCGRDELKNYLANIGTEKHGKWIVIKDEDGSTMSCSECGFHLGRVDCDLTPMAEIWQYCPHCGAKMDGRE